MIKCNLLTELAIYKYVTVPQSQNGGRKIGGGLAPHFLNLSISLR